MGSSALQSIHHTTNVTFLKDFIMLLFKTLQWRDVVPKIDAYIQQDLALVSPLNALVLSLVLHSLFFISSKVILHLYI